ncbi:MAG: DUF721 domain-containing protein [Cyanothece sp. SIO2G6]|nr:DUF721 domain-containing protein [Cyanothece sp. SIO2G6]
MAFSSLGKLVGGLERRPQWRSHQQFQAILEHWPTVVGEMVAAQTHPIAICRQVLNVSTSSPVWAQNLGFQRHHILTKLSVHIPDHTLKDIRFSPAQWPNLRTSRQIPGNKGRSPKTYHLDQSEARQLWSYHPCQLPHQSSEDGPQDYKTWEPKAQEHDPHPVSDTPTQIFHNWAVQIQARSQHLPRCPSCSSPTPIGELERWGVCSLCAAKRW